MQVYVKRFSLMCDEAPDKALTQNSVVIRKLIIKILIFFFFYIWKNIKTRS